MPTANPNVSPLGGARVGAAPPVDPLDWVGEVLARVTLTLGNPETEPDPEGAAVLSV